MRRKIVGIGVFLLIVGIVMVAFAYVDQPHTTAEPYQAPWSSIIMDRSFTVPPAERFSPLAWGRYLTKGNIMNVQLEVTDGGDKNIDFYVENDEGAIQMSATNVTTVNKNWTTPSTGTYYFIFDNRFDLTTSKNVTAKVTRHWTQTEYNRVTEYYPLLPNEFSYVGLIFFFAGVSILIFGLIRVRRTPSSDGA